MNILAEFTPTIKVATEAETLETIVKQIRFEAEGINSYELTIHSDSTLPNFTAGSHIDVYLPNNVVRQYSLSNCPNETHRYVIAVLKDKNGQGGSISLHESLQVGQKVIISQPRNHFQIVENTNHNILIAGGIGITPLKSMAHYLADKGQSFELHYCARSKNHLAFKEELESLRQLGKIFFHLDQGNPQQGLDLEKLLMPVQPETHVYYCGPQGFMKACADFSKHWPSEQIHFEHFKAPIKSQELSNLKLEEGSFTVKIASSGQTFIVAKGETLSDALIKNGVEINTSCISGLCGTCKIPYLEGEISHQDYILSDQEQKKYLTACVSRATSGTLVLDL